MSELADHLGLEKQTMSGLIARAEKRGLVARARNEDDGRATDVFLTVEGDRLVAQLRDRIREELAPVIDRLDPARQAQLKGSLRQKAGMPGR